MPGMMDSLATMNSVVRTVLALVVVGAAGVGGLFAYRTYNEGDIAKGKLEQTQRQLADVEAELGEKSKMLDLKLRELANKNRQINQQEVQIDSLNETIVEKDEVIQKQATSMRLLKKDRRLAIITVLKQEGQGKDMITTIRWAELDEENRLIDDRTFDLKGDIVKVDAWIVKFDDKYIEEADLIRGTSIYLFRRIHGEFPQPDEVHPLDEIGSLPNAYRRGKRVSDFEREIWDDFWKIANDPEEAEKRGIRAAHGEIVYIKVLETGKRFTVQLRASDGLTFVELGPGEPDPTAKPAA